MPAHALVIRDATSADHDAVMAINDREIPAVNLLPPAYLDYLISRAAHFRVAEDAEGVAGFVICLPSGGDYDSENYEWFTTRYDSFLYLDRVVVAERARGRGVGSALYADLHAWCAGRYPRVTLEVNLRPPNEGSVRFHERLGYRRVGIREYDGGEHAVLMYERQMAEGRGKSAG